MNNSGRHSSGATAALNAFYGREDIPVGVYKEDVVGWEAADFFQDFALDTAAGRDVYPDAVDVYRRVLSEAAAQEVVIVSVGHLIA